MIARAKVKGVLLTVLPTIISLILIASFVILPAQAAEPPQPQLQEAPMREPPQQQPPVIDGHGTGFIPQQVDLSHLTGQQMPEGFVASEASVGQPPDSFDWRTTDKVTSVKDQGTCGSCYAFASIANIESKMLIDGAATLPDPDYSENNAKECNYWETATIGGGTSCSGGNYSKMANWFSKKGTVLESCDPYAASDVACNPDCPYHKTLLDWRIICDNVVPDTNVLKNYIRTYGPVYTTMYASFPGFGSYDGSYTLYYTGTETPNHAVLIVGWDNSLPHAGSTGGWIVKNSWGTEWGDEGYFTIAYGSASIGMNSSFIYDWQNYDDNGDLWYYDEGGWTTQWGYGYTTAWGLCKFMPSSDTYVKRVEFWTTDVTTDIGVYIYDDFDGANLSNLLASKLNNSFSEAGYHSVELDTPLPVTVGDDVIAVVKFTNSSFQFPIAADNKGPNETGRTYISHSGADGTWADLGIVQNDDIAIRVRTSAPPPPSVTTNHATNKTTNSATLNGSLDSLGGYSSVDVSFEWGTTSGALDQETTPETMDAPGPFSFDLSGLSPNTTYYFRSKATGSVTVYGVEMSFTTPTSTYDITLFSGWNLISLPLIPDSANIEDILAGIMTNISTEYGVCTYDAPSSRWYTFCPGWGGDLTTMTDGKGYWIYVTNPCTLTINGGEPSFPYEISLFSDWNLVGLPLIPEPANIEDILAGIMDNISTEYGVCTYDAQSSRWYTYCPGWGGDLTTMTSGKAYWIYVINPCTLTVEGS